MTNGERSFEKIHAEYRPKVLRYLTRMVGPFEAADLTQEVFLKVNKSLETLREDSSLSTWIYRIATNTAIDRKRSPSYKRSERLSDSTSQEGGGEIAIAAQQSISGEREPTVEQQHLRDEVNHCIRGFIEGLPDNYRTVVVLGELEGMKNQEIADILNITLDTVKIRLHRARAQLRRKLELSCDFDRDDRGELSCDLKSEYREFSKVY